ncbi:DUF6033 family protein [Clostridium oryzae]|uniref:Uncharacterized protein n=1 Tax=Clostridium oryzae TaxID=1450648 RepID=A0A1V4IWX8_9CLOT|nr:DUF6033 family protein [Clostridium oryzae]OPJ64456.1 hypothetical protein CLORY_06500 [Clostridium oryzae]
MSVEIDNRYGSCYEQVSNKTKCDVSENKAGKRCTSDKGISKYNYFKNICSKYQNLNINMSDAVLGEENKLTINISPKLVEKATKDPKASEKINYLLDQMPSLPQFIEKLSYSLTGKKVTKVSIMIDENGECRTKCEFEDEDTKKLNTTEDHQEKLRKKKIKALRERAKALKEARKDASKDIKGQQVCGYYDTISEGFDSNLLDTKIY